MALLVRGRKARCSERRKGTGPQRVARESPREGFCWGEVWGGKRNRNARRRIQKADREEGKKSPSLSGGDHKGQDRSPGLFMDVLCWRQHLKDGNVRELSDSMPQSSYVDIIC